MTTTTNALGPASDTPHIVTIGPVRHSLWQRYKALHGGLHLLIEGGIICAGIIIGNLLT